MKKLAVIIPLALGYLATASTAYALFGPIFEGVERYSSGGDYYLAIEDADLAVGGIDHDLDPANWFRYRVKLTHSGATGTDTFYSSSFPATGNKIQICDVPGCEAASINVGTENLDWEDTTEASYYLQAKSCPTCSWVSYEMEFDQ